MERIFPIKYAILSFRKCLNYKISGFQRGDILLLKCDNTELKTLLKKIRTASLGGAVRRGIFFFSFKVKVFTTK